METILLGIGLSKDDAATALRLEKTPEDLWSEFEPERYNQIKEEFGLRTAVCKEVGLLLAWMQKEGITSSNLQDFDPNAYRAARNGLALDTDVVDWICSIDYVSCTVPFIIVWEWQVHDLQSLIAAKSRLDEDHRFLPTINMAG